MKEKASKPGEKKSLKDRTRICAVCGESKNECTCEPIARMEEDTNPVTSHHPWRPSPWTTK
jgi:hypothetical protein